MFPQRSSATKSFRGLRDNPNYLARKHMVRSEGGGIRQLPGPGNALGRIKFEMPNEFDAYLHDTPLRSLFAKAERHLSHGCIRVGQIQPLASFALNERCGFWVWKESDR